MEINLTEVTTQILVNHSGKKALKGQWGFLNWSGCDRRTELGLPGVLFGLCSVNPHLTLNLNERALTFLILYLSSV